MANSIGSHLSDSEEVPVFENKVKPLEDQLITAGELKVRLRKKNVTESVTKIENTIKIIQKAADYSYCLISIVYVKLMYFGWYL